MKINYWDCEYGDADERNIGTDKEPYYKGSYYCYHAETQDGFCWLENKFCGDEDECSLLDI